MESYWIVSFVAVGLGAGLLSGLLGISGSVVTLCVAAGLMVAL